MKSLSIVAMLAVLLAACGKAEDSSSDSPDGGGGSGSPAAPKSVNADKPWEDPEKPILSDKKLDNFVGSLKDPKGPFDAVSKGKVTAFNATERMDEFEAAAKKHGFSSGEEYLGFWMRINAANMQVMQEESNEMMIKAQEDGIKTRQEMLKKPDLTPETRQQIEEGIKGSQESLEILRQPREGGVNAQDVESFKKHKAAFEEAMKKWTK